MARDINLLDLKLPINAEGLTLPGIPRGQLFPEGTESLIGRIVPDSIGEISSIWLMFGPRMGIDRAGEDPVEGIVVPSGDRVEFMIVAPGATDGEPEEGLAEIIERVLDGDVFQTLGADPDSAGGGDVAGGNGLFPPLVVGMGGEEVSGNLLAYELVVGLVPVKGVDHVIAISIGFGNGKIRGIAGGVGVAGQVEPVAAPPFAVGR